jgi:hypothetical protein
MTTSATIKYIIMFVFWDQAQRAFGKHLLAAVLEGFVAQLRRGEGLLSNRLQLVLLRPPASGATLNSIELPCSNATHSGCVRCKIGTAARIICKPISRQEVISRTWTILAVSRISQSYCREVQDYSKDYLIFDSPVQTCRQSV